MNEYDSATDDSAADAGDTALGFLNADNRTNVAANGKPSLTIEEAGSRLIGGAPGWSSALGVGYTVTYAFRADAPGRMPSDSGGFQRFNSAQIDQAEQALRAWADVANIVFTRVGSGNAGDGAFSNEASILFGNYTSGVSTSAGFANLPGNPSFSSSSGDVWINGNFAYNNSPSLGNYGRQVLVHEIGHAIGLDHPSKYNSAAGSNFTYAVDAEYYEDSRQYTVMSYFNESNTGGNFRGFYAAAPLLDDVSAAQQEYGVNTTTRTGDTVYGFNSNADHAWYKATSSGTSLVFAVWDAGGVDTLDFSGYSSTQTIELRQGFFSSVGGLTGNVVIARGADIENARGGAGADLIHGNALNNNISGGTGNDVIDGGSGGSNVLRGDDGADTITGGADFDDINGNKGNDVAHGGAGRDWVVGGQDNDLLFGDEGDDVVYGNLGSDTLSGGEGADWVRGGQGDDIVDGGTGDDLLWGDRGNDTVTGGAGADIFHFFSGADIDRIMDFKGAEGDRVVIDDGASYSLFDVAGDLYVILVGGDVLVLPGMSQAGLQAGWIS